MQQNLLNLSYTLDDIDTATKKFWQALHHYRVLTFSGDMGAGKTTFIHHLCSYLRVEDTVSSPTFALVNEYHFNDAQGHDNLIYHMDWYRVRDANEAADAGMEDCILQAKAGNAYCFVEWPEKAPELLTSPYVSVSIETISAGERKMSVVLM